MIHKTCQLRKMYPCNKYCPCFSTILKTVSPKKSFSLEHCYVTHGNCYVTQVIAETRAINILRVTERFTPKAASTVQECVIRPHKTIILVIVLLVAQIRGGRAFSFFMTMKHYAAYCIIIFLTRIMLTSSGVVVENSPWPSTMIVATEWHFSS